MIRFVWDSRKAAANARKHGIAFEEAATVFGDPLSLTVTDAEHSKDEIRLVTMGAATSGRILVVAHVDRGDETRIVSARKAAAREKRQYHDETEK